MVGKARRPALPHPQRGAALVVALLMAALVVTTVSLMLHRQAAMANIEWQLRETAQVRRILQGAEDWALLILKEDARQSATDHLGEPWAIPLKEGRLSDFLKSSAADDTTNGSRIGDVWLSGRILDAQARYNLMRLATPALHAQERDLWLRVAAQAGLPEELALRLASRYQITVPDTNPGARLPPALVKQVPLTHAQLEAEYPELSPHRARLEALTVILPQATPVNVNTAGKAVLATVLPGLGEADVARFEELRLRAPWRDVGAINAAFPDLKPLDSNLVSVSTRYFFVQAQVRLKSSDTQATELASTTLVERTPAENRIGVVRRDPGVMPPPVSTF